MGLTRPEYHSAERCHTASTSSPMQNGEETVRLLCCKAPDHRCQIVSEPRACASVSVHVQSWYCMTGSLSQKG
jgi:hypothetical protein